MLPIWSTGKDNTELEMHSKDNTELEMHSLPPVNHFLLFVVSH